MIAVVLLGMALADCDNKKKKSFWRNERLLRCDGSVALLTDSVELHANSIIFNSGMSGEEVVMKQQVKTSTSQFFGDILMLLISVTLMAGVSGCEKEKPPLKVGFVGSLTGRYSDLGVAGRNGATLAVEHINEAGGIQGRLVELIVKDDKNDPDVAVQVDKELINEGVAAIIGHMTSAMSKAAVPLINEKKIVMVSPTTTTNDLTGLDDYFFRTGIPDLIQYQQLIRYAFHEQKVRKLAIVYDLTNRAFSEGWYQYAKAEFERLGGIISAPVTFTSGKSIAYADIVEELLRSNPEGVLMITSAIDTAILCQELQKAGSNLPMSSSGWAGTAELIQYGGTVVEGIVFLRTFDEQSEHKKYLEFKQQFAERFNIEPNFASAGAYNSAQLLLNALAQTDDPGSLKKAMLAQPLLHALQGDISMDQYGDPHRDVFIFTVRNGEFTHLKNLE